MTIDPLSVRPLVRRAQATTVGASSRLAASRSATKSSGPYSDPWITGYVDSPGAAGLHVTAEPPPHRLGGFPATLATADGIRLIDKETMRAKVAGTKSAFARKNFSSYLKDGAWSDELEDEWATRENWALPLVRQLNENATQRDDEKIGALKVLAAIHYVRSYAFEKMLLNLMAEQLEVMPDRLASDEGARGAFVHDYGRPPEAGEIERIVVEQWTQRTEGRAFLLERMADGFGKTFNILEPLYVQLVWPKKSQVDFVFADGPLVHSATDGRLTALGGVALGDADQIFFPIGPQLMALFMTRPETFADGAIPVEQVQLINGKSWQSARDAHGRSASSDKRQTLAAPVEAQSDRRLAIPTSIPTTRLPLLRRCIGDL